MINDILFWKNYDGVLLKFLKEDDANKVLSNLHDRPTGGHKWGETSTHENLRCGYYSLTLFKDAHA